ncbi:hypothetical protein Tco_0325667, partial [Tanacetum coccineum]
MNTPSKEDLDNLFGPMFEEYFEKTSSNTTINSAAQRPQVHKDSSSISLIFVDAHEAPSIVTTSDEQTSPISLTEAHTKIFYIRKQKGPGKPKEEVYSNSKIIQVVKTYWELGH